MSYAPYLVTLSALAAASIVMASWLFRRSGAPFAAKIVLPLWLVAATLTMPYAVSRTGGLPVPMTTLPDCVDLVAFREIGDRVALWILEDGEPLAVSIPLTEGTRAVLREVQPKMRAGGALRLCRAARLGSNGSGSGDEIGDGLDIFKFDAPEKGPDEASGGEP